jgi:hypothetical protein
MDKPFIMATHASTRRGFIAAHFPVLPARMKISSPLIIIT